MQNFVRIVGDMVGLCFKLLRIAKINEIHNLESFGDEKENGLPIAIGA